MFEETIRELRRLDGRQQFSVSILSDVEGYFDRECPSDECLFQFKVYEEDWREKVHDEEVFCPFCGHAAASDKWWTEDQRDHINKVVTSHIDQRLGRAMRRDADRWNRRQPRDNFISMTMRVDSRPRHVPLPPAAAEPMQLKIICPECACRYAVIGSAFFCPACGNNSAELLFDLSLTGIRNSLDALAVVRTTIPNRNTAETTVRLIVENGLQNAVTAFQRYAEALYAKLPVSSPVRRNAFQNLKDGSDLWHAATGRRYSDHLEPTDLTILTRAFQQRHLLAHTQGIVDQDYIARSGDTAYRPGQRVVVRESAIRDCVDRIEKLASGMAGDAQGIS